MREVFTRQGGKVLRVTTHRCRVDGAHRDGSVPDDFSSCKFYAAEQLMADIDFISPLCHARRRHLPADARRADWLLTCSPMLAVIMLSFFELAFVRKLIDGLD